MRTRTDKPGRAYRYALVVSYDGTHYAGYQIQPGHPTIQAALEAALKQTAQEQVRVFASGRTDQGVHARGQVIHFDLRKPMPAQTIFRAMNAVLPPDIRVERARRAPQLFDARMNATSKEYRYFVWNGPTLTPDVRQFRHHVWRKLDLRAMRAAAKSLEGRHDFAAFTANPRREVEETVRTLYRLSVRKSGSDVVIVARGDGFLYRMVRSLAGFLIRVGMGEIPPAKAKEILHSKIRTALVPTAPPQGLFLWRVSYSRR